jgi:hypothetical protein
VGQGGTALRGRKGWPERGAERVFCKTCKRASSFFARSLEAVDDIQRQRPQRFQCNYLELLDQQRTLLHEMNHRANFDEDIIRKYLALLDLEEYELR